MANLPIRPVIFDYPTVSKFCRAMLNWRKHTDPEFSVRGETRRIRGLSPSLVTQVIQGKRRLTGDRVSEFGQLLKLNQTETRYLGEWVQSLRARVPVAATLPRRSREAPQNHLLQDWLNIYVKDAAGLRAFSPEPGRIHHLLGGIAPIPRIARSLAFLLKHGYLRRTLEGRIVKNEVLTTTTDGVPVQKIRAFHKQALRLAQRGLDLYPVGTRRASAVVMSPDERSADELRLLLREFHERLMDFAERNANQGGSLYQVLLNLTPIGGRNDSTDRD